MPSKVGHKENSSGLPVTPSPCGLWQDRQKRWVATAVKYNMLTLGVSLLAIPIIFGITCFFEKLKEANNCRKLEEAAKAKMNRIKAKNAANAFRVLDHIWDDCPLREQICSDQCPPDLQPLMLAHKAYANNALDTNQLSNLGSCLSDLMSKHQLPLNSRNISKCIELIKEKIHFKTNTVHAQAAVSNSSVKKVPPAPGYEPPGYSSPASYSYEPPYPDIKDTFSYRPPERDQGKFALKYKGKFALKYNWEERRKKFQEVEREHWKKVQQVWARRCR